MGRKIIITIIVSIFFLNIISFFPDAAAGPFSFDVSAVNTFTSNTFGGPMVIQVTVTDPLIASLNTPQAEPDVTVNGNKLRMAQIDNGRWIGFFAEVDQASGADSLVGSPGLGLDFGKFCGPTTLSSVLGVDFIQTSGVAIPRAGGVTGSVDGSSFNPAPFVACTGTATGGTLENHVVREPRALNTDPAVPVGQIGIDADIWPVIQLYDFVDAANVVVTYNRAGGSSTHTLTFDSAVGDFASLSLDRSVYPRGSDVHFEISDFQLNIDPTDEDSWTFATPSSGAVAVYYQLFDENGAADADGTAGAVDLFSNLSNLMFSDNGILRINPDEPNLGTDVLNLQDTDDQQIIVTGDISTAATNGGSIAAGGQPITLTQAGINSELFVPYDENDVSGLFVTTNALRGSSGSVTYNNVPSTVLVGFSNAFLNINPVDGEWNSGEEIPILLTDGDANKNTRVDEDLDLFNPDVERIPTLETGTPFTLETLSSATLELTPITFQVQPVSHRAVLSTTAPIPNLGGFLDFILTFPETYSDLYASSVHDPSGTFTGTNWFNYDVRSIGTALGATTVDVFMITPTQSTHIVVSAPLQGIVNLDDAAFGDPYGFIPTEPVSLFLSFPTALNPAPAGLSMPIVADFFSFGYFNDGVLVSERVANQVIRVEAEETGDDTNDFQGSLEFTMVNQLNILDPSLYAGLRTIADDPNFIVIEDLTDEDSPRLQYLDLDIVGLETIIADVQAAPTHSGIVTLDQGTYTVADTVTITLQDVDISTDRDLIDIFIPVNPSLFPSDPARETIGKDGLPVLTTGQPLGQLVEVTFDNQRWSSGLAANGGACGALSGSPDDGLTASSFVFVETGIATGVFNADFQVPSTFCNSSTGLIESTSGKVLQVNYFDFRDASGEILTVSDLAGIDLVIKTWDGGGDGVNWSDPLNWSGDTVPLLSDTIIIDGGVTVTYDTSFGIFTGSLTIEAGSELISDIGSTGFLTNGAVLNSGTMTSLSSSINIQPGGTLTNDGTINVLPGGNLQNVNGLITNNGAINSENLISFGVSSTFNNNGDFNLDAGSLLGGGILNNNPSGKITNNASWQPQGTINNDGVIINNNSFSCFGTLNNNAAGIFYNFADFFNNTNCNTTNDGIIYNDVTINVGAGTIFTNLGLVNNSCSAQVFGIVSGNPPVDDCSVNHGTTFVIDGNLPDGGDCLNVPSTAVGFPAWNEPTSECSTIGWNIASDQRLTVRAGASLGINADTTAGSDCDETLTNDGRVDGEGRFVATAGSCGNFGVGTPVPIIIEFVNNGVIDVGQFLVTNGRLNEETEKRATLDNNGVISATILIVKTSSQPTDPFPADDVPPRPDATYIAEIINNGGIISAFDISVNEDHQDGNLGSATHIARFLNNGGEVMVENNLRVLSSEGNPSNIPGLLENTSGRIYSCPSNFIEPITGNPADVCTDVDGDVFVPASLQDASTIDCNDGDSAINPVALEIANGIDDDCDGIIDDGSSAPDAPTGLVASAVSGSQIDLTWNAPGNPGGSPITGYKIERNLNNAGYVDLVANTGNTLTTFSDSPLNSGDRAVYRVSAINAIGTGPASNEDVATIKILRFTAESYGLTDNAHIEFIDEPNFAGNALPDSIFVTVDNLAIPDPGEPDTVLNVLLTEVGDTGTLVNIGLVKFTSSFSPGPTEIFAEAGDTIQVTDGVLTDTAVITTPTVGVEPTTIDRLRFGSDSYRINFEGRINANFNEDIFKDDPSLSPTAPDETQIYLSRTQPTGANPLPAGGFFVQMVETGDNTLRFQTEKIRYTTQPNDPNGVPIKMQTAVGEKVWAVHQYPGRSDVLASTRIIAEPPSAPTTNFVPPVDTPRFDCGTPISLFDSDFDGICDEFEDGSKGNGLIIDSFGTTYEYNDPTTGDCRPQIFNRNDLTNPNYGQYLNPQCPGPDMPDLYVEIDFMTGHSPNSQALFDVVDLFYQNGIRLHLQIDENLGFHTNQIKFDDDQADFRKDGFRQQKEAHFGSILEKTGLSQQQLEDKMTNKRQVFHYGMFIHHITEFPTVSGWGEVKGNDFIISMGAFSQNVGTRNQQGGTLLHEIGHNLNLRHNGDTDLPNCVPHYLSAMNYLYQFKDFTSSYTSPLDLSHLSLNDLDELLLVESVGISPETSPTTLKAIVGGINNAGQPLGKLPVDVGDGDGNTPVNFNRDNDAAQTNAIQQNIHWFDVDDCRDTVKQNLESYNDWANLDFNFIDSDNFMDGIIYLETTEYSATNNLSIRTAEINELNLAIQELLDDAFDSDGDNLPDAVPDPLFAAASRTELSDQLGVVDDLIAATPEDLTPAITELDTIIRTSIQDKLVGTPYEADIISILDEIIAIFEEINTVDPDDLQAHSAPGAADQAVTTDQDNSVFITLVAGDPDENDTITFEIIAGSGPTNGVLTGFDAVLGTVTYEPNPGFSGTDSFQFKVTDNTGLMSNVALVTITVHPGPTTTNVEISPNPVPVDTALVLTANTDDSTSGASNIASAQYNIDGGASVLMTAQDGAFDEVAEDVTANVPAFTESNVHDICVSGTDAAGVTGEEECIFLAVYDPSEGFVTGGGWINSPEGAYVEDPSATGKASFGFVSKYKKGQSIPTGNTQFNFKAVDLNFHSTEYDWLVIAGPKAQFKGTGEINGAGNYGFMLTAIDGERNGGGGVDKFRVKIWDKDNNDTIVYDNNMGSSDTGDPSTALGGGSIVIHDNKGKK